jgi:hypothetical protein
MILLMNREIRRGKWAQLSSNHRNAKSRSFQRFSWAKVETGYELLCPRDILMRLFAYSVDIWAKGYPYLPESNIRRILHIFALMQAFCSLDIATSPVREMPSIQKMGRIQSAAEQNSFTVELRSMSGTIRDWFGKMDSLTEWMMPTIWILWSGV